MIITIRHTILAMLCIAVCNSLTISKAKDRDGRAVRAMCATDADCDVAGNNEVCATAAMLGGEFTGICVCNPTTHQPFPAEGTGGVCVLRPSVFGTAGCTPEDLTTPAIEDTCNVQNNQFCNADPACACAPGFMRDTTPVLPAGTTRDDNDECIAGRGAFCSDGAAIPGPDMAVCAMDGISCQASFGSFSCNCEDNWRQQVAVAVNPPQIPVAIVADNAICNPDIGAPCLAMDDTATMNRDDCTFPNQRCLAGTCQCNANFVLNTATPPVCVASIGAPCPMNNECTLPGQTCIVVATGLPAAAANAVAGAQTCGCMPMFVEENGVCNAGTGAPCAAGDADCATGMLCYAAVVPATVPPTANTADPMPMGPGVCSCRAGMEPNGFMFEDQMGMCVRSLGTACPPNDPGCGLANSECSDANPGVCVCEAPWVDTNTAATAGGACSAKVGAACPLGTECMLDDQVCQNAAGATVTTAGAGQTCGCEANFGPNADNTACLASVGAPCPLGTECMLPSQVCQNAAGATVTTPGAGQTCGCIANFAQNAAGACVASLGAACPNGDECTLPDQACNDLVTPAVCANTVGGACPNGHADCPLTRQQCDTTTNPAAPVCACDPGWAPDANNACNDWPANFCGGLDDGCTIGQGDCDDNNDCRGPLLCGVNNCDQPDSARPLADCCVDPSNPTGEGENTPCDGTAPNAWGCCTPQNQCGENQGDCDNNDDCLDGFICQADSCTTDGFGGIFPAGQIDCCQPDTPTTTGKFYSNFVDGMDLRIERWTNDEEPARPRPKY